MSIEEYIYDSVVRSLLAITSSIFATALRRVMSTSSKQS